MLTVTNLAASYAGIAALRQVDFTIDAGEMVAVIGPNGAGKSTLLNCLSGTVRALHGSIRFAGTELKGRPAHAISRQGLLHVPEGRQILGDLTVEENLLLGRLAGGGRTVEHTLESILDMFPALRPKLRHLAGTLSGGQQQMLAIGRALMGQPRLLLLDEPSLGLSPLVTGQVMQALTELNARGLTILLVEQNARRALQLTRRAYVLERGSIAFAGDSVALASDARVVAHYLGHAEPAGAGSAANLGAG